MQEPVHAESHAGSNGGPSRKLEEIANGGTRSHSRENTPSTMSSHSLDTAPLDRAMSSASVDVSSGSSLGKSSQENREDVDKFLRKMDMEKVGRGDPSCDSTLLTIHRKCKLFSSAWS